jgi:hypothetical protein
MAVLLFKRILDFKKPEIIASDKRGARRYPVGAKSLIKAKLALPGRDGQGSALTPGKGAAIDWGGQLADLSSSGASIRLHPAAIAAAGDKAWLKLEIDNMLFELDATVAHFRVNAQHVSCGIILNFPDTYSRRAYLQLMEPIVIGSTLAPAASRVKQDLPGLVKEQYAGESETELSIWRDASGKNLKLFELLVHDFHVRGNTELPGLKIGYRDGAKAGKRSSRPAFPLVMSAGHKDEVRRLFQFIVQNLTKAVPSEVRKFLELFTT